MSLVRLVEGNFCGAYQVGSSVGFYRLPCDVVDVLVAVAVKRIKTAHVRCGCSLQLHEPKSFVVDRRVPSAV